MSNILITGATGNLGFEVIRFLTKMDSESRDIAGVRNIEKAKDTFKNFPDLDYVHFDFEDFDTFDNALIDIDRIFLLRPPHISDIDKYFNPLLSKRTKEFRFLRAIDREKAD